MTQLFNWGSFNLHSGASSNLKIDCDALTDEELEAVSESLCDMLPKYRMVIGVPGGGSRLANFMKPIFSSLDDPILIVDDVLTTGQSMEQYKSILNEPCIGAVIFCRNRVCPEWITPLFTGAFAA